MLTLGALFPNNPAVRFNGEVGCHSRNYLLWLSLENAPNVNEAWLISRAPVDDETLFKKPYTNSSPSQHENVPNLELSSD